MTWLDLYNYLHDKANNIENIGKYDWQKPVTIFDFNSLSSYDVNFTTIKLPNNDIAEILSISNKIDYIE